MKRFFLVFILVLSLFLEVGFFTNLKIFGVVPNIFLMLLIALSFIIPEEELLYAAFFGSLFLDLFSSSYFGFQTIIILFIIFIVMLASYFIFSTVNVFLLIILATISTVFFEVLSSLALVTSGINLNIIYYLQHFLVSKIIINSILILLFYFFASSIWEKISKLERRVKVLR